MPRVTAHRGYGPKLIGHPKVKIKGINQVHKNADTDWSVMWSTGYDWTGWLKRGIDAVKANGSNTVKVTGLSALALNAGGTAFQPALIDHARQYLDYTRSVGLYVYWQVNSKTAYGSNSLLATAAIETARLLRDYPHVIGLDLWNEPDAEGAASTGAVGTYLAAAVPTIRQTAPAMPLTVSLGAAATWASHSYLPTIAPYVDFYDWHVYETDTSGPVPTAAQIAAWRSSSYYKPYLYGETGTPGAVYFDWPFGDTQRTTYYTRLIARCAEPDCYGAVAFCLTDYDAALFGFYPESFSAARSSVTAPFASWPNVT